MSTKPELQAFLDKPLPNSEAAEKTILGGILLDGRLVGDAAETLRPDEFYSPLHRRVYEAMLSLSAASSPIDPILIGEELKKTGSVESIGGVATITNLTYGLPHFTSIDKYIEAVKSTARLRALIRVCSQIQRAALDEIEPADELIDSAEQQIFELSNDKRGAEKGPEHIGELSQELLHQKVEQINSKTVVTGFSTGLKDLDSLIGGCGKGDYIVVAARPSMGKTALVTKMLFDGATEEGGEVVVLFSCEMRKSAVTSRIICQQAMQHLQRFNLNKFGPVEWQDIVSTVAPFPNRHFLIDDTPGISPAQMQAKLRRIKAKYGRLDAIGVDYIQLMSGNGKHRDRYSEVTSISRDLKGLAMTMDAPLIALSQLSRSPESRNPPRPMMSDLRESGAIEQDADVVAFVYRPAYYEKTDELKKAAAGKGEIIVAKQRNGPTDTVHVTWKKEYASFVDLAF